MVVKKFLVISIYYVFFMTSLCFSNSSSFMISPMPCWNAATQGCSDACISAMAQSVCSAFSDGKVSTATFTPAVLSRYCKLAGDAYFQQYKDQGFTEIMRDSWVDTCTNYTKRSVALKSFLNALAAALYSDAQNTAVSTNVTFGDGNFLSTLGCLCPYKVTLNNLTYNPKLNPNCPVAKENIQNYMGITVNTQPGGTNALKSIIDYYANSSGILSCSSYVTTDYQPATLLMSAPEMLSTSMSNSASNAISLPYIQAPTIGPPTVSTPVIVKPVAYSAS